MVIRSARVSESNSTFAEDYDVSRVIDEGNQVVHRKLSGVKPCQQKGSARELRKYLEIRAEESTHGSWLISIAPFLFTVGGNDPSLVARR